ncbi:MAG TPA: hypothetical protein VEK11_03960 [Thermoanaerobaculia bacterium]|nr:hypothetical protein [Thermoanaerobaculia bacterium]
MFEADRVMSVIGPYCSLCERPLRDGPEIWDTARDAIIERIGNARVDSLLMLCVNCAGWQRRTAGSQAGLLLPDWGLTFRARGDSPYRYSLERVTVRIVDDNETVEEREDDAVIVSGSTPEAIATIERFRLNTPYYDAATKRMTIPRHDALTLADRRVVMRTEVWHDAADLLSFAGGPALHSLRSIIEAGGFWSVWLTLFAAVIPADDMLGRLFGLYPLSQLRGTSTRFLER